MFIFLKWRRPSAVLIKSVISHLFHELISTTLAIECFLSYTKCFYTGWVTGTWRVLKRKKLVSLPVRRDAGSSVTGLTDVILVVMEQWAAAPRAFVIIPWTARSSDLSVCDFFLWGYLKSKVNLMKPRDINELKYAIKGEITATWWQKQLEPYVTDWSSAGEIVEKSERCALQEVRGQADTFWLHLNRKRTGKDILMKYNKKEIACINYFQSCIIIFLQNHHALQYTSANAALVFEIRPSCFVTHICLPQFSIFETPCPASYCTHITHW